jgi:dipeptidyl aminopeptidase/acylaminoacyl peptidase
MAGDVSVGPMPETPLWEQRFRAPAVTFPSWARDAPDRLVYASNEPGAYQVFVRSPTSAPRQVTDVAIGVAHGELTPDGERVVWFDDTTGDEVGRWVTQPFTGDGATAPLAEGVPDGWSSGLAIGTTRTVIGVSDDTSYRIYVDGDERHAHAEHVVVQALSRDERLLVYAHAEHGDSMHKNLRAVDVETFATVADLDDGADCDLDAVAFSPVDGDDRVVVIGERTGVLRPSIWNPTTSERAELALDELPGDVTAADWWPDAGALLLVHHHEGRDQLVRYDLATHHAYAIAHTPGEIAGAAVRPDGDVWYAHSSGALAPTIRSASTGDEVLAPEHADPAPPGHPYRSWHFANPHGDVVHGFVVEPPGDGPHPTVMLVHGGPQWQWFDGWRPEVPAWVDHGFAVALVNYRGSTGYGPKWRDALIGDPGFVELTDLVAGLDDLVAAGVTDPARVVLAGRSWGGYLTLLGLGRHPDRWAVGDAVVPVADYVAAYEDEAPGLKALDRMLFGGSPTDVPELYEERSPITYVDAVDAPVLIIAGDNDTRCPIRQIVNYVDALEQLGKPHRFHRYDAGHGSMVIDERVDHMRLELGFVLDALAGARQAP